MLSLASLLNPAPPGPPPPTPRYRPSPASSSPATSYSSESPSLMFERHILSSSKPPRMAKETSSFVKSRAKGTVNYPPYEALDDASLGEIQHYQIQPFGRIQEFCRHIPYNSGKKNFFDKTGRESFEVFQYTFKVPGDESEYTVMWDYNVGLVRMTPFFKCCKYSKTQPAKMLNMNPGLRDITHSITGGSIMAQGYWMPFTCAKAVCATFCASIAGALIPIFGPKFPLQCIPPDAPEHGRMVIDQAIVAEATREAELYRRMYANTNSVSENSQLPRHHHYSHYRNHNSNSHHHHLPQHAQHSHHYYSHGPALPSPTSIPSPRLARPALPRYGSPHDYEHDHAAAYDGFGARFRSRGPESPYGGTSSEPEMCTAGPATPLSSSLHHTPLMSGHRGGGGAALFAPLSPPRSNGWTVVNNNNHNTHHDAGLYQHGSTYREERGEHAPATSSYASNTTNPLLSAIPRFGGHYHASSSSSSSSGSSPIANTTTTNYDQSRDGRPSHHHRLPPLSLGLLTTTPTPNNNNNNNNNSGTRTAWGGLSNHTNNNNTKRPAADLLDEEPPVVADYDDYDNHSGSSPTTTTTTATSQDEMEDDQHHRRPHHHHLHKQQEVSLGGSGRYDPHAAAVVGGRSGADKSAALLLMNLSMKDERGSNSSSSGSSGGGGAQRRCLPPRAAGGRCAPEAESVCTSPVVGALDGHRSKRRRATSM